MVSWLGVPCCRLKYCFSSVLCSFAKRAISTQLSAFAAMAKNAIPVILFRGYLIFLFWRKSDWFIIFRSSKMFPIFHTLTVSYTSVYGVASYKFNIINSHAAKILDFKRYISFIAN